MYTPAGFSHVVVLQIEEKHNQWCTCQFAFDIQSCLANRTFCDTAIGLNIVLAQNSVVSNIYHDRSYHLSYNSWINTSTSAKRINVATQHKKRHELRPGLTTESGISWHHKKIVKNNFYTPAGFSHVVVLQIEEKHNQWCTCQFAFDMQSCLANQTFCNIVIGLNMVLAQNSVISNIYHDWYYHLLYNSPIDTST